MESMYRIGIDLGGTKTESVLIDPAGNVLLRKRRQTPLQAGYDAILLSVAEMVRDASSGVPVGGRYTVGIGIPGSLDAATGLVRNANSLCLRGRPLQKDLEELLGRTIAVRNDADCFTLAECREGAGVGYPLVFGVIMGTGCGGGISIDGEVRQGPHRICGEWGHMSVDPAGVPCYCGNVGCVETKISGSGVEAAYQRAYGRKLSMDRIVTGARNQDRECERIFNQFLDDFGRSLACVISLLDPDAVVLGGGLSNVDELYSVGVERLRRYVFHEDLRTPILKNKLGDSAGVFGAAWIGACL